MRFNRESMQGLLALVLIFSLSVFSNVRANGEGDSTAAKTVVKPTILLEEEEDDEEDLPAFFDGFRVGGSLGLSLYYGDLAVYDIFPRPRDWNDYFRSGWRLYVAKEIKWGLGARIQFEKGSLEGGRQPGLQSKHVSFRAIYHDATISAEYDLFRLLLPHSKAKDRKWSAVGNIGIGLTWFRSFEFATETNLVENAFGYSVENTTEPFNINMLDERVDMEQALILPVGFTLGRQLNYKTDLTFTVSQMTVFSDKLDARVKPTSARDKFGYFGVGLRYNFNRDSGDFPDKKKKEKRRGRNSGGGSDNNGFSSGTPNNINVDDNFRSKRTLNLKKKKKGSRDGGSDELLDVRLKMFEIQMKLFEMQYLLND